MLAGPGEIIKNDSWYVSIQQASILYTYMDVLLFYYAFVYGVYTGISRGGD